MYSFTHENVVGIGKIKLYPTKQRPYDIPILHYIVIRESDGTYSAVCIELRIDANADTVKEVRDSIISNTQVYIDETFRLAGDISLAYHNLQVLTEIDEDSAQQWNVYRACQLQLAKCGIKTDIVMELEAERKYLLKRIVELESAQRFVDTESYPYSDEFMEVAA